MQSLPPTLTHYFSKNKNPSSSCAHVFFISLRLVKRDKEGLPTNLPFKTKCSHIWWSHLEFFTGREYVDVANPQPWMYWTLTQYMRYYVQCTCWLNTMRLMRGNASTDFDYFSNGTIWCHVVVENAKSTNPCFAKPSRSWKPRVLLKNKYIEIWIELKV